MKTVLFLGAGRHQRAAILQAKEMGLRVAAIDGNPNALALPDADIGEVVNFVDIPQAVAFAEKGVTPLAIDAKYIYRELLKKIVETYTTGKPPIDIAVTVEIVAFIEGAWKSANNHGTVQKVEA